MRSTLLIGCLIWGVACVYSMTSVDSRQKRAPSPQIYQGQQGGNFNQSQFQWVKENGQWVRRDGTKLPGYSAANVPYNQTGNQWKTPESSRSPSPAQPGATTTGSHSRPGQQQPPHNVPARQDSTASQGSIGWDPSADRALTQDLPKTTPRPTVTTTRPTPHTPPPAQRPQVVTPPPARAPFGSGIGGQKKPQGHYNPDISLTYGGVNPPPNSNKTPVKPPNQGPSGSNPWGNLSR